MNTKRRVMILGIIGALSLGGCVVTPHHGSVGYSSGDYYGRAGYYGNPGYSYNYGYRPVIRSDIFFGNFGHIQRGHSHRGHGHFDRGHHRGGQGYFRGHGGRHGGHRRHH